MSTRGGPSGPPFAASATSNAALDEPSAMAPTSRTYRAVGGVTAGAMGTGSTSAPATGGAFETLPRGVSGEPTSGEIRRPGAQRTPVHAVRPCPLIYGRMNEPPGARPLRCRLQRGACTKGHPTGTAEGGLSLSYFATDQTRYGRVSMRPSAQ